MAINDPLGDLLTRIRNAQMRRKDKVSSPGSKLRAHVLDVYISRFRPMRVILTGRDERTMMKLIVDRESQRVIGCHVFGPDAAEMVQMAAIAMRMEATKADFDRTMALHPSAAEELVTMRSKRPEPAA